VENRVFKKGPIFLALTAIFSITVQAQSDAEGGGTGTAIVEVITEPEFQGGTLRFEGTPSGLLTLLADQRNRLDAVALSVGANASTLAEMGPLLSTQGYTLERIVCDDDNSAGDVSSQTANFEFHEAETVVCQFRLVAASCACPRAGTWRASNLLGSMVCTGPIQMTVPLPANTTRSTLEVGDSCQSLLGTKFSDEYGDVIVNRVSGCSFEGTAQGTPMEILFTLDVQSEEFITGSLHSEFSQQGATCTMSREFELRFEE
jgi:hypothetical protein